MIPGIIAAHTAAASCLWGLLKTLIPLPALSGFMWISASTARPNAGARAAAAKLLLRVVLPGAAGITTGTLPYYAWSRRGGREVVERWCPWFGLPRRRVKKFERDAVPFRAALIFGLFALPFSPVLLAAVVAGLLETPLTSYLPAALAGTAARCSVLAALGWVFRSRFGDPVRFVSPLGLAAGLLFIAGAVVWALISRRAGVSDGA